MRAARCWCRRSSDRRSCRSRSAARRSIRSRTWSAPAAGATSNVGGKRRRLNAAGNVDRVQHVGEPWRLQVDVELPLTVGARPLPLTRCGSRRGGRRLRVLERDGLAVHVQRRAVLDQGYRGSPAAVRSADASALLAPTEARRPQRSEGSALPVMDRSAPVELLRARDAGGAGRGGLAGIQSQGSGHVALYTAGNGNRGHNVADRCLRPAYSIVPRPDRRSYCRRPSL